MEKLINKWKNKLSELKKNRAEECDAYSDEESNEMDKIIEYVAEFCRDLIALKNENNKKEIDIIAELRNKLTPLTNLAAMNVELLSSYLNEENILKLKCAIFEESKQIKENYTLNQIDNILKLIKINYKI